MDIIERHFAAENAHDVAATLATYTDDVIWDDVGHPACPVQGKSATGEMYEGIMDAIPDLRIDSVLRFGDERSRRGRSDRDRSRGGVVPWR